MSKTRNLLMGVVAATSVLAIASTGLAQNAGGPPAGGGQGGGQRGGQGGGGAAARAEALHTALKLTAAQEAGWKTYQEAVAAGGFGGARGPVGGAGGPGGQGAGGPGGAGGAGGGQRPAMTPELQAQMQAALAKRTAATATFRATLTPEQQVTFDAQAQAGRGGGAGGRGGQGGGGGGGGGGQRGGGQGGGGGAQ